MPSIRIFNFRHAIALIFLSFFLNGCYQKNRAIIKSAIYQSENKQVDVFPIIEKHLTTTKDGEVILDFSSFNDFNEAFGDPQMGSIKVFTLTYHYINQGKEITISLYEPDFKCNKVILLKPQN